MKEIPKYLLIADKIKHEIKTGEYNPNDQLPKEFDLANAYNVSRITIRNALSELERQDLIYRNTNFLKSYYVLLTQSSPSNRINNIIWLKF